MSQCVPSLDHPSKFTVRPHSSSISFTPDVPTLDYEVAELTWENGQLAMHSLGPPRVPNKFTWDRPRAGGTLESIVNPAALLPHPESYVDGCDPGICTVNELVPWFDHKRSTASASAATAAVVTTSASATMTMDALVPSSNNNNRNEEPSSHVMDSRVGTCAVDCSARVGSCSTAAGIDGGMVARGGHEWSSCREQSVSGSATFGRDSRQMTLDTCDIEFGVGGFTSTSMGSLGNTSSGKECTKSVTGDDHDSVCHSKPQREACDNGENKKAKGKYSVSTKRSRAAAIHNQSERKRRDKINQRMKTLQKLVPNSSKTDKASMLDEVIEYLKQLQAQINMMSRMNMSPAMMLPMAMQQQLQMSMMAPMMGMGMGMGHVMDLNSMTRPNLSGLPPVIHPSVFMPMTSWDGSADRLPAPSSVLPDPLSTFLACQSQPMTMDAYSRMAALYQQMNQAPGPTPKN